MDGEPRRGDEKPHVIDGSVNGLGLEINQPGEAAGRIRLGWKSVAQNEGRRAVSEQGAGNDVFGRTVLLERRRANLDRQEEDPPLGTRRQRFRTPGQAGKSA